MPEQIKAQLGRKFRTINGVFGITLWLPSGWYWQVTGQGDPVGPFELETDALANAGVEDQP